MNKLVLAAGMSGLVASTAGAAVLNGNVVDLGTLSAVGRQPQTVTGSILPNELLYVTFTLADDINAADLEFLDITSNDTSSTAAPIGDSEVGLYSGSIFDAANTALVASDDDDGFGLYSTLSFGFGSGQTLGDSFNLGGDGIANGEDGDLAAGEYILVFGEFNVDFGATVDGAVSDGPDTGGTYEIDFVIGVIPEPTTLALAGLGGLTMLRRRRA